jgi:hypothetical protein
VIVGGISCRHDQSGDGGGGGGRSDGWWLSGSHVSPMGPSCMYFYQIFAYIYVIQKYFMILRNIGR